MERCPANHGILISYTFLFLCLELGVFTIGISNCALLIANNEAHGIAISDNQSDGEAQPIISD